ncbi:PREDICTED: tripartite motif-containing protein 2-like [Acropora digitifera]|uniref:tripartite motif-containing protein 2-like n=1 Tax=Acropora digitifera TaxID=70779 RepID=UPI00077AD06C|nr:PREDICTED: tripartite motif-containing protein 2-like [Acropora digitifera]
MLKRSTNVQIMEPNEFLDQLFREESNQQDTVDLDGENVIDFGFERNEELFNDVHAKRLGFLKEKTNLKESTVEGKGISEGTVGLLAEIVVITRNIMGEQVYDQNNRITLEIRNHDGQDCSTKPQIHDNKDGSYKISYFAKETGTCQASVKVNGQHVRGSPFKTQFKPRLFKPVLSFGKHGSAPGMFNSPSAIAVNDRDEIAVTDSRNHRIQMFLGDGTHLRSFGRQGNQQGQFNDPNGIIFHVDNIIVSDSGNHRIQIFDDQGHYLHQFGEKGKLNHQLDRPSGLSIDRDGNIIGKFLYKFGIRGTGDGEFNSPRFLSLDKAGHLLVCDARNGRVQVFKLTGEFITKFGASGEEEEKMKLPISTAFLGNGRIIVTNFCSHRVQVFE